MGKDTFVDDLDALRNYVQSLGWMDEAGPEQARDILTNLTDLSTAVFVSAARKFPDVFSEVHGAPVEMLEKLLNAHGVDPVRNPDN